jgi:hypothetical protein
MDPGELPALDSPERWGWLQRLRRQAPLELEPWLAAIEAGSVAVDAELLAVLSDQLTAEASVRLLRWWFEQNQRQPLPPELLPPEPLPPELLPPELLPLIGQPRHRHCAAQLRQGLEGELSQAARAQALALLGHQRDPSDLPLLLGQLLTPQPLAVRRGALEALSLGLSCWPRRPLRAALSQLVGDLDPGLAGQAVDLLARQPRARPALLQLARQPLDPAVASRIQRRLAALGANPLVLIVHGRAGGELAPEWPVLARELESLRGAAVLLQPLTAPEALQPAERPWPPQGPITLAPLLHLPGGHVRDDLPRLASAWRRRRPLLRLPFLGAWPRWQQALAAELASLIAVHGAPLHLGYHPVRGQLPQRYLEHLARQLGTGVVLAPYSAAQLPLGALARTGPPLTLALAAANEGSLLRRPGLRRALLELLEALP